MKLFDSGSGLATVVVPGIAGRWEWMLPGLEALAARGRTISYSLCGESGSGWSFPSDAPFETHLAQLDAVLEKINVRRAVLCGVSFGGWITLRYVARRPSVSAALILASTPGPRFTPNAAQARYMRRPLLMAPLFMATAPARVRDEIAAALPRRGSRLTFAQQQLVRIARAPMSPRLMARRIKGALGEDFVGDCHDVRVPTLVLTGEQHLDQVVPPDSSRQYLQHIAGARHTVLKGTGHQGIVTRPEEWAQAIADFVRATVDAPYAPDHDVVESRD